MGHHRGCLRRAWVGHRPSRTDQVLLGFGNGVVQSLAIARSAVLGNVYTDSRQHSDEQKQATDTFPKVHRPVVHLLFRAPSCGRPRTPRSRPFLSDRVPYEGPGDDEGRPDGYRRGAPAGVQRWRKVGSHARRYERIFRDPCRRAAAPPLSSLLRTGTGWREGGSGRPEHCRHRRQGQTLPNSALHPRVRPRPRARRRIPATFTQKRRGTLTRYPALWYASAPASRSSISIRSAAAIFNRVVSVGFWPSAESSLRMTAGSAPIRRASSAFVRPRLIRARSSARRKALVALSTAAISV